MTCLSQVEDLGMTEIFVVAYLSLFDGELKQEVVYAKTELEALNKYLNTSFLTEEELYQYCADCDSFVNVLNLS